MRPHPIYIIKELLNRALAKAKDGSDIPATIDRNCSPSHAFRTGYLQALQDMGEEIAGESASAPGATQ